MRGLVGSFFGVGPIVCIFVVTGVEAIVMASAGRHLRGHSATGCKVQAYGQVSWNAKSSAQNCDKDDGKSTSARYGYLQQKQGYGYLQHLFIATLPAKVTLFFS